MNRVCNGNGPSKGMTLPELMVGLAVGLFVATVAISTFVSTRTLNVVNSSSTRMTENARLATETLHTDLRSAGFAGCRTLEQRIDGPPVIALNTGLGFITDGSSGIRGYSGTGSAHSPALPTAIATALTAASLTAYAPRLDSDVISVRVPADAAALGLVSSMGSPSAAPQVEGALNTIALGDVVLVSNCKASAIFQVTSVTTAGTNVNLNHDALSSLTPGNSSTDLQHVFRSDANVYRMQTRHYYVAPSKLRAGTNSLWRLTVPGPAGGAPVPEEVASGIDRLVVAYGVDNDTTPDLNVNQYVTASGVTDWDRVLSARLQLLSATAEDRMRMQQSASPTYTFFDGSTTTPTDKRMRTLLTEVVTLRNGAP